MNDKLKQAHIFQITDNHSPAHPGVTEVITQLTRFLASQRIPSTVLAAAPARTPVPEGVTLVEFPVPLWGRIWRYPHNLGAYLKQLKRESGSIFHLHGVWGAPQWLAARAAIRQGIPSLLTAHDMLSPWHWQDGRLRRLKKLVYWHGLAYPVFRQLPIIHAITPQERDNLAPQFPGQRLEVIPNAIDLQKVDAMSLNQDPLVAPMDKPYLLFVGRLHPKKGVDPLIEAFARAHKPRSYNLLIVGPDSTLPYTYKLKEHVRALGLDKQVFFLGPVFGAKKWHLYRHAWAFCAPSHSEVVGLVNLEAAALRVPVITTFETGLFDWQTGGGLLIHPQISELTSALEQVFAWSESERAERGLALRQLVERRYSWEAVGAQWLNLYADLRGVCK